MGIALARYRLTRDEVALVAPALTDAGVTHEVFAELVDGRVEYQTTRGTIGDADQSDLDELRRVVESIMLGVAVVPEIATYGFSASLRAEPVIPDD